MLIRCACCYLVAVAIHKLVRRQVADMLSQPSCCVTLALLPCVCWSSALVPCPGEEDSKCSVLDVPRVSSPRLSVLLQSYGSVLLAVGVLQSHPRACGRQIDSCVLAMLCVLSMRHFMLVGPLCLWDLFACGTSLQCTGVP
jgi:hypothetical protein